MITAHILIMDENPTFSELVSDILEEDIFEKGLNVQVTAPGTFLVEVAEIERLQPDLILMALRRDGTQTRLWTCMQHLKSHQATKDIPVVLYNGYSLAIVDPVPEQEPMLPWGSIDPPSDPDEFASRIRQLIADLPGK